MDAFECRRDQAVPNVMRRHSLIRIANGSLMTSVLDCMGMVGRLYTHRDTNGTHMVKFYSTFHKRMYTPLHVHFL